MKYTWRLVMTLIAISILLIGLQYMRLTSNTKKDTQQNYHKMSEAYNRSREIKVKPIIRPALNRPQSWSPLGLGEFGVPAKLENLTQDDIKLKNKKYAEYGIDVFLSEKISLHRLLKDSRHESCRQRKNFDYENFPTVSIIIVFYNEAWSLLMRTIFSILHNTPSVLLEEIILVDDFSSKEHLKLRLEDEIKKLPNILLVRTSKREGLIRSKLIGVSKAKGKIVAFIDAHCECMHGWLEPLVEEIHKNSRTVAIPVTDDIDSLSFKYNYGALTPNIGGFTWRLYFHWRALPADYRLKGKSLGDPIETPTMSGGLFAINKDWFLSSGSYDSGMEVWGGENIEMSFRIWMCGGSLKILPCSHIGHVSRDKQTYSRKTFWKNVKRVADVWLDDHKKFFYRRIPKIELNKQAGDVSNRMQLRTQLQCHNFQWYLDNVYPIIEVPEDIPGHFGTLVSGKLPQRCLDLSLSVNKYVLKPYACHGYSNQFFELRSSGELIVEYLWENCIAWDKREFTAVKCFSKARKLNPNCVWIYEKEKLLKHKLSGKCLTLSYNQISMNKCDITNTSQHWQWKA